MGITKEGGRGTEGCQSPHVNAFGELKVSLSASSYAGLPRLRPEACHFRPALAPSFGIWRSSLERRAFMSREIHNRVFSVLRCGSNIQSLSDSDLGVILPQQALAVLLSLSASGDVDIQ
jgi:hypothetical protein